jgi:DDE_Tnp_1-associated/Transposase DDE domain
MLKEILKQVPDPRGRKGRDYELWSILSLILIGFLCGRRGLLSVYHMGQRLTKEQQRALGFRRRMPCHATLTETMRIIDADKLADVLGSMAFVTSGDSRHIAIDGKTMRGSKDEKGHATHCVSAFCQDLQQVLTHTASEGKGMEIPDALALLDKLVLKNNVVTADALLCQKSIAAKIVEREGDYVLPVKDNQKLLREDIQTAFEMPVFPPPKL